MKQIRVRDICKPPLVKKGVYNEYWDERHRDTHNRAIKEYGNKIIKVDVGKLDDLCHKYMEKSCVDGSALGIGEFLASNLKFILCEEK